MSAFYLLCSSVQCNPTESIVTAIQKANEAHDREELAALKIQATARGMFQRRRYQHIVRRIIDVQRTFRGYLGRKIVLRKQMAEAKKFHEAYFFYVAAQIQRMVRGYLLRKNHVNFYARKRYLMELVQKSEAVRSDAQRAYEEQQLSEAEAQHAARVNEYRTATNKKHHLLSTCSIPGVYRPPLTDGVVTVFGTNVEDDIRQQGTVNAKDSMVGVNKSLKATMTAVKSATVTSQGSGRKFKPDLPVQSSSVVVPATSTSSMMGGGSTQSTTGTSPAVQATGGSPARLAMLVPHAPTSSLQNAVPYDYERQQVLMGRSVDQKFADSLHNGKKFGMKKPDPPTFATTINAESQYVERSTIIGHRRK